MEKQNGKVAIDDLAVMIQKGFENVDNRFKAVDDRFKAVDDRFKGIDDKFESIENQLTNLEHGQEDIKLRLTEVAHRFELRELAKRVEKLEKQLAMQ